MKNLFVLLFLFVFISCGTSKKTNDVAENSDNNYANLISLDHIKKNLYKLASDEFEGRRTGENGQKIAANFIADYYKNLGINHPEGQKNYFQEIPVEFFKGESKASSENVIAYIPGNEKPEELIVISAHYDHLGIDGEKIYNGADDDASGTSAVMEIARVFQEAKKNGDGPKRSILFLHLTGEEEGLFGSKYYTSHPLFSLKNTVCNLNIDMVGRVDKKHKDNPDFVYLIGSDKLSSQLHNLSEEVNKKTVNLELDYTYNSDSDPNRFYYRSDHYNFAKNNIPIIFYFNGTHDDYHKATDTADKINYEVLTKRTLLIFNTAWDLANRENRIVVDK